MRAAIPLSPSERWLSLADRVFLMSHGILTSYLAHEIGPASFEDDAGEDDAGGWYAETGP